MNIETYNEVADMAKLMLANIELAYVKSNSDALRKALMISEDISHKLAIEVQDECIRRLEMQTRELSCFTNQG